MATNSLQSLHHHHQHYSLLKRYSPSLDTTTTPSSLLLKPSSSSSSSTSITTSLSQSLSSSCSSFSTTSFSISPNNTTSTTPSTIPQSTLISCEQLQHHLSTRNFFQADEETRRLLIVLAGEAAQKRGYVFFSEVQFVPEADLKAIDSLWREYSNDRFGYSVQRKIWKKVHKDFTKFFLKVGWMKKLDTEVEQYNYRSFPTEFTWEFKDDSPPPVGHLPLTNALRGTQLLNSILRHPAFDEEDEAMEGEVEEEEIEDKQKKKDLLMGSKPLSNTSRVFKTDYSF